MQNLDSTVVATALPTMAKAFGADPLHMNVALTSYLLSLAVFIPASGWFADRFGTRTVFRAAIVVFTLGSIACGRAETLTFLVASRILQGIGGAMMVPVGRLVLLRGVAKGEIVAAMAWLTLPALLGPVLGPPLGGFIVTYSSWRWIFDINVPIGVIGVVLVSLYVEDVREPVPKIFDFKGLILTAAMLAGIMFGVETAGRGIVPPEITWLTTGIGLTAAAMFWVHARRHPDPLLDLGLMRLPTFAISILAGSLFRIGVGAVPFLLPLMLQLGFGRSALQSGLITFVSSAGAMVMKPVAQFTLRTFGFRSVLVWNGVLSALLLAAIALIRPSWPLACIYGLLFVGGFFRSLQFTSFNAIAYADIPRERMSAATSLYSTVQQLSLTLGIALGAAVLEVARHLTGDQESRLVDFTAAFCVVAGLALLAAPLALRLPLNAGNDLTPGRAPAGPRSKRRPGATNHNHRATKAPPNCLG
jgi:EmrB/QacA subfamily drug resistance transporter